MDAKKCLASRMVSAKISFGNRTLTHKDTGLTLSIDASRSGNARVDVNDWEKGEWAEVDKITQAMGKIRDAATLATRQNGIYLMSPQSYQRAKTELARLNAQRVDLVAKHDWAGAVERARQMHTRLGAAFDESKYSDKQSFIDRFYVQCTIERHPKGDELLAAFEGAADELVEEAKAGIITRYAEMEQEARSSLAKKIGEPLVKLYEKFRECAKGEAKRFFDSSIGNVQEAFENALEALPDCDLKDQILAKMAVPVARVLAERQYKECFTDAPGTAIEGMKKVDSAIDALVGVLNTDMPEPVVEKPVEGITEIDVLAKALTSM